MDLSFIAGFVVGNPPLCEARGRGTTRGVVEGAGLGPVFVVASSTADRRSPSPASAMQRRNPTATLAS